MSFCYAVAWLFHFKMSPNTAMYAQRLRNGSIFSPYSRVLRYRCVKRAQLIAECYTERTHPRESWSDTEVLSAPTPVSFAYYMSKTW